MIQIDLEVTRNPVTDEERQNMTYLINMAFSNNHDPALSLNERGIFVMMTMLKEQQDALFEINKSM